MKKKELTPRSEGVLLGAHMSIAGGISQAFDRALSLGCTTMQLFVKNSTQWSMPPLPDTERLHFHHKHGTTGIHPVLAHSSYLINLAAKDGEILRRSRTAFKEELERCHLLGIHTLILHPGSHGGAGEREGLKRIAESLNCVYEENQSAPVTIALETTAGQGTSLGSTFEQLRLLIDLVERKDRLGVCIDTCHIFASGYDIRTEKNYETTFQYFDAVIGLHYVVAFHINDSLKECGSHIDRHTHIGKGKIGITAFRLLMKDKRFARIPKILETPKGKDLREDKRNLRLLLELLH